MRLVDAALPLTPPDLIVAHWRPRHTPTCRLIQRLRDERPDGKIPLIVYNVLSRKQLQRLSPPMAPSLTLEIG